VEAILEATARVLLKEGYDGASTNRIAKAAGVSVGSLYQYFPSKESLAAALIDRHQAETEAMLTLPPDVAARPLHELARLLVRNMLRAHAVHPRLHQLLMEQMPRVGRMERARDLDVRACQLVRGLLESRKHEIRRVDLDLATFVIISSVEAVTHEATINRPELLVDIKLEDELVELVLRYLGVNKR
jgi:AcrR family transcriptional regulator